MRLPTKESEIEVSKTSGKLVKLELRNIRAYKNNAKLHTKDQVAKIRDSIQEFGYKDLIAVDEKNIILEGHGRLQALYQLDPTGTKEINVWKIEDLTEPQKKAYRIAHNKLNMDTGFDDKVLTQELTGLKEGGFDFNLTGFSDRDLAAFTEVELSAYSDKIVAPTYEPRVDKPKVDILFNKDKYNELIKKIETSNIPEETKKFLRTAASRHIVFDYKNIADFYSHSDKEVQELMEQSALVVIDFNKAIENGFVDFNKAILEEGDA